MSGKQAKVGSLEALSHFHQSLLHFNEESLLILSSIRQELHRRNKKIRQDLPEQLRRELKQCEINISDLKQSARMASTTARKEECAALGRKERNRKRELEEREYKLKQWLQKMPALVDSHEANILKMKGFMVNDMSKAAETLKAQMEILEEYTRLNKGGV